MSRYRSEASGAVLDTKTGLREWFDSHISAIVEAKRLNLMTPTQYADAIERLGLSQRSAGRFLGVDERQSRRWVAGDSAIPESVAKLLRLMIRLKISPEDVT